MLRDRRDLDERINAHLANFSAALLKQPEQLRKALLFRRFVEGKFATVDKLLQVDESDALDVWVIVAKLWQQDGLS